MSYQPSASIHGLSDRIDIFSRILIPIMLHATIARPFPHIKGQRFDNSPARATHFTAGEEAVNGDQLFAVARALVSQHRARLTKTRIVKRARKAVVPDHTAHVQIFDADQVKASHQIGRNLVQMILTGSGNAGVNARNLAALRLPPLAAFGFTRKMALLMRQLTLALASMFRVSDAFAAGKRGQTVDAEVHADAVAGFGQFFKVFIKAQRHEVTPATIFGYRDCRGHTLERPRPTHFDAAQTRNCQRVSFGIELKRTARVFGALRAAPLLKRRVACALVEEVLERGLQVSKRLLRWHARNFVQPHRRLLLFQFGERRTGLIVVKTCARAIQICAQLQAPVEHESHATEHTRQMALLIGVRTQPIAITNFAHKKQFDRVSYNLQGVTGFLPSLKAGGSALIF